MGTAPSLLSRALSNVVSRYPIARGRTKVRKIASPYLVKRLPCGAWMRVSGVVDAEWELLKGTGKAGLERATTELISLSLDANCVFVDAEANVGYFSLLAASRGAHVLAYEPTLAVYRRLKENFALNGFSGDLVNAALSDKAGTVKLYESDDDPEANSIFGNGEWSSTVRTVSLDRDLIRFGVKRVDLLKIDVEGAEPMVLDGAKKLLSSVDAPDLIIEVNAFALKAAGSAPSEIYRRLSEYGYAYKTIDHCTYKGLPCLNVFATKRRKP